LLHTLDFLNCEGNKVTENEEKLLEGKV
jgi:hypothetical protein